MLSQQYLSTYISTTIVVIPVCMTLLLLMRLLKIDIDWKTILIGVHVIKLVLAHMKRTRWEQPNVIGF